MFFQRFTPDLLANMFEEGVDDDSILQEIPSSEDSEDDVPAASQSAATSKSKEIKDLVHVKLSQLHELISDDEGDDTVSPIGSPPAEISILGGRAKFLELKRKLEEDQARKRGDEEIQPVQVTDVQTLLESFNTGRDQTKSTMSRIEANPKFLELYQQVKDRDHKIIDLEAKLMEQSRQIIDLEDNLLQKEKLLTSKNEAVSVVQRKFEAELLLKQQDLEKSQRVLFEMERNLGKVQDQWKEDKVRLTAEIQREADKYKKFEDSSKEIEAIRFQLSTDLAEAKETIIELQQQNTALGAQKSNLEEENRRLQNDMESLKLCSEKAQETTARLNELETELKHQQNKLETEKENLAEETSAFESERLAFYAEKELLGRNLEDFDEERTKFDESKNEFEATVRDFDQRRHEFEEELNRFSQEKSSLQEAVMEKSAEVDTLKETLEKYQTNMKKMKAQFQAKLKAAKEEKSSDNNDVQTQELKEKLYQLENKLVELEEEKGNLLLRLVDYEEHSDSNTKSEALAREQEELLRDRLNLDIELESLNDEKERLNEEKAELGKEKEVLANHRLELMKEREQVLAELSSKREVLDQEREKFYEEIRENRENLETEKQNVLRQLRELETEREAVRNERESVMAEYQTLQDQRQSLLEQQALLQESQVTKELHEASQMSSELSFGCNSSFSTEKNVGAFSGGGDSDEPTEREAALSAQIQDLTEKLETAQKNVKKLKLQFQAKLKQIKGEQKEQYGDEKLVSEIKALENKVTELEEEKGNLLLRLVDYEELQVNHEKLKNEVESLQVSMQASELEINTLSQQQLQREADSQVVETETITVQLALTTLDQPNTIDNRLEEEQSSQRAGFEARVQLLTQEIAVLENALTEKSEQITSLEEQIEFNRQDFAAAVQDFDSSMAKKNEEIEKLRAALKSNSETMAVGENAELTELRQELAEVTEEKNQEILRLTGELAEVSRVLDVKSADLSRKSAEFDRVIAEYWKHSSDLDQLVKLLADSEKTISENTLEFMDLNQSLEDSNYEKLQLSAIINELREQIRCRVISAENQNVLARNLTAEVAQLKAQLFESNAAREATTREMEELKALNNPHIQSLSAMEDVLDCEGELARIRAELLQKSEDLENANQQLTSMKSKLQSMQEELEAFQLNANDLEVQTNQLESMKLENAELKSQMADKDEELEFTVNELLELRTKFKAIEADKEKSQESKSSEISSLCEENQHQDQKIKEAEQQISTLSGQIAYLETSLAESQSKYEAIEALYAQQEVKIADEIAELKKQLLEKDEEVELSVTELCNLRAANRELQSAQETHMNDRNALLTELESVKQRLSEAGNEMNELIQEKVLMQDQLQDKLNELSLKDQRLMMLEDEVQTERAQIALKEEIIASLRSESKDLQSQLDRLAADATATNSRLAEMTQLVSQSEDYDILKSRINSLEAQVTDKDTELESTVQELLELRSKCNELQMTANQVVSLQLTIEDLRSQLIEKDEELYFTNNQIMSLSAKSGQVEKVTKSLQEAQLALAQKTAEHTEQLEVIENLQKEIATINYEKSRAANEITELQSNMQHMEQAMKSKTEELEFTGEEMMKLRKALDEVERDVFKDIQDKEVQMEQQLQQLQAAVNEKDDEIKKVMSDYDEYYNQARTELEMKVKAIEVLEQNLFEKNEIVTRLEQTILEIRNVHQTEVHNLTQNCQMQINSLETRIQELSQIPHQSSSLTSPQVYTAPAQSPSTGINLFGTGGGGSDPANFFDSFGSGAQPVQESLIQSSVASNVHTISADSSGATADESKDKQIYDQEVLITELQITVEELKSQLEELTTKLSEVHDLKAALTELQAENNKLRENVKSAVEEHEALKSERKKKIEGFLDMEAISGPKDYEPPPNTQPVTEPPVVRTTAYETTDKIVEELTQLIQDKDKQIASLNQELRELKVKSGKVLQKLRQTTNKYDELAKAHESLKTKSEFSLESAFENEVQDQLKKKDELINELQAEKQKLQAQVDIFERTNDKLVDNKENQDSLVETLVQQKKQLEYEVSGLKWKIEELESILNSESRSRTPAGDAENTATAITDQTELESLKAQNNALSQEITNLQLEVNYQREVVASLHAQLQQAYYNFQQTSSPAQAAVDEQMTVAQVAPTTTAPPPQMPMPEPVVPPELVEEERIEREILEQKIELLQNKISELEINESRYYEDLQKTKTHAQMLDMENLQYQDIIADLNRRLNGTERENLKSKILQEEVNRLILALDEKDNSKYAEITSEIFKLQEEKSQLEYQLGVLNAKHTLPPDQYMAADPNQEEADDIRIQLSMLERQNLVLEIDLRREANARRVLQEQLFFHQAAKSQNHKLGALVGNSLTASMKRTSSISSSPSRHSPLPAYNLFASPGGHSPKIPSEPPRTPS